MRNHFPKWLIIILAVIVGLSALCLFYSQERIETYQIHMRQKWPEVQLRLAELSKDMDEAAVKAHFAGLSLSCRNDPASNLGDRMCYADVDKANGMSALGVAVALRKGKLTHAIVMVPWWAHGRWFDSLTSHYGPAVGSPVIRWSMPNGSLEFNRNRSINPLEWSVVFFSA